MQLADHYRLSVVCPVRIDIAGAWTDCPQFCKNYEGNTLNMAIAGPNGDSAVTGTKFASPSNTDFVYNVDVPPGSGLGSSGALNLCQTLLADPPKKCLELAVKYPGTRIPVAAVLSREKATEYVVRAHDIEAAMGVVGGYQDMQAAMFGGLRHYFYACGKPATLARPTVMAPELYEGLFCVKIGGERASTDLHRLVWDTPNYEVLEKLAKHAREVSQVGIYAVGYLAEVMNYQTQLMRELSAFIVTAEFYSLRGRLRHDGLVLSGKPCGAGGTGFAVFVGTSIESYHLAKKQLPNHQIFPVEPARGAYLKYEEGHVDEQR